MKIICAGLVGWDYIGRANREMSIGNDLPGLIIDKVGGVAGNIALALVDNLKFNSNLEIILLSGTGIDSKSDRLIADLTSRKIKCDYIERQQGTSDSYICIEAKGKLFAALASSLQLEMAGINIFKALENGGISSAHNPFDGYIIIDSNLSAKTINYIIENKIFDKSDIIIACASPFKSKKLKKLIISRKCTIYATVQEASAIANKTFHCSSEAARFLFKLGAKKAIVTDGEKEITSHSIEEISSLIPKKTKKISITGAGDSFLAAHLLSTLFNQNFSALQHLKVAEIAARQKISNRI